MWRTFKENFTNIQIIKTQGRNLLIKQRRAHSWENFDLRFLPLKFSAGLKSFWNNGFEFQAAPFERGQQLFGQDGFDESLGINTPSNVSGFQRQKIRCEILHRHQEFHLGLFIASLIKYCASRRITALGFWTLPGGMQTGWRRSCTQS